MADSAVAFENNVVPFPIARNRPPRFNGLDLRTLVTQSDQLEATLDLVVSVEVDDELGELAAFSCVG